MNIRDVFKKVFGIKKVESNYEVKDTNLDLMIDDDLLLIMLGQWMGVYPDCVKTSGPGLSIYESLDPKDFKKRHKITVKERNQIENRFAMLLQQAGYNIEDICILEDYDNEEYTFTGNFFSLDGVVNFGIRFGDFFEECPNMRINDNGSYSIYNYDRKKDKLSLESVTKELENGNTFHRYVSEYSYYGDVYNDSERIEVAIKYPEPLNDGENTYVDEEMMEVILSSVVFPISIEELCNRIASCLMVDSDMYPSISIVIKKNVNDKSIISDEARFKDGKFEKLVISKDGKKVTVDRFDNWSYDTDTHTINHTLDNEVSYGFKSMPVEQFEAMPTPQELVNNATNEVEAVKGITLSLMKKNKSN